VTRIPIACTLEGGQAMDERLADWRALLGHVGSRQAVDGGLRLELTDDVPVAELARLVVSEQECCRFFAFAITVDERGVALEVRAPEGADEVVASLFGAVT
jgi:hypothetical protein